MKKNECRKSRASVPLMSLLHVHAVSFRLAVLAKFRRNKYFVISFRRKKTLVPKACTIIINYCIRFHVDRTSWRHHMI